MKLTKYDHQTIETKWQQYWEKEKLFKANDKSKKKKFYCLDMFPYPSGAGLHVGHPEGYTATDIYSRYLRMNGYEVLHPIGWDAFGLPAENYAIKTGKHPKKTTLENIKTFKRQIQSLGFSYDWDREFTTSDPSYYKWSQWFFLLMYKNDLAYQKKAPVNWCESCKTVLANEQVVNGKCERCKNEVIQKELKQWFFKVTKYADKLLKGLDKLDWPESLKHLQRNWIGKSIGCNVSWKVDGQNIVLDTFTTTVDTIYGVTFAVISPEHPQLSKLIIHSYKKQADEYIKSAKKMSEIDRMSTDREKTGVFTGTYLIHPFIGKKVPLWVADYVLMNYGTGVVMGVPAHDQRDMDFASKYKIPIIQSVVLENNKTFVYDDVDKYNIKGKIINSDEFSNMPIIKGRKAIIKKLKKNKLGSAEIQYKIRDWLISRQRYWGAPIPIIYCDNCGTVPVPEKDLPVKLPDDVDFRPKGKSPLSYSYEFMNVKCPKCGGKSQRETDTMDGFVDNSWYYFRYCDPKNTKEFANKERIKKWMPVDLYIGGAEHAVGHLLYSRFFTKVLYDISYIKFSEPFKRLINQGIILAPDGRKMSKSLGNVINPDEVVIKYGADTFRMYEMFMGPLKDSKPWDTKGIKGIRRFLDRVWQHHFTKDFTRVGNEALHLMIKKVTEDINNLKFNTAISAMMIYLNLALAKKTMVDQYSKEQFAKILAPFAPHLAEEIWRNLGHKKSIFLQTWSKYDQLLDNMTTIVVQINGKVRAKLRINSRLNQNEIENLAFQEPNVKKYTNDKKIKKTIYISGKILSFVV